jgi:hypothetical protein
MLLVWHHILSVVDQGEIRTLDPMASFWPRSWSYNISVYNHAVPSEWWISFSSGPRGLIWVLRYPERVEIIYRD